MPFFPRAACAHAGARVLSTLLLSLALLVAVIAAPANAKTSATLEEILLAKINHARTEHGLDTLRAKPSLMTYARDHSSSMASAHTLFHTSSFAALCCWSVIGENIAYDQSVRQAHRALMRSPGHRANLLDPRFRQVGVGIVERGGSLWVTEVFRKPA